MNLRKWLFIKDISVKKFAQMIGMSRSHFHAVLNGSKIPSKRFMDVIRLQTKGSVKDFKDLSGKPYVKEKYAKK